MMYRLIFSCCIDIDWEKIILIKFSSVGSIGPGTINEGGSRGSKNQNAASAKQGISHHLSIIIIIWNTLLFVLVVPWPYLSLVVKSLGKILCTYIRSTWSTFDLNFQAFFFFLFFCWGSLIYLNPHGNAIFVYCLWV